MINVNAKNVAIIVDGVAVTGFAEGTFVTAEPSADRFEKAIGAAGEVGIAEINDPTGTVTFTVMQSSDHTERLTKLAKSGKIFPITVIAKNNGKTESVTGTRARVVRMPTVSHSNSVEGREFQISVFDYDQT